MSHNLQSLLHKIIGIPLLFSFLLSCCQVKDARCERLATTMQVKTLVERSKAERAFYHLGSFDNPVSETYVKMIKQIPNYRQSLFDELLDAYIADNEPLLVHICDIIAGTGDRYFIGALKRLDRLIISASSGPHSDRMYSAMDRTINALENHR